MSCSHCAQAVITELNQLGGEVTIDLVPGGTSHLTVTQPQTAARPRNQPRPPPSRRLPAHALTDPPAGRRVTPHPASRRELPGATGQHPAQALYCHLADQFTTLVRISQARGTTDPATPPPVPPLMISASGTLIQTLRNGPRRQAGASIHVPSAHGADMPRSGAGPRTGGSTSPPIRRPPSRGMIAPAKSSPTQPIPYSVGHAAGSGHVNRPFQPAGPYRDREQARPGDARRHHPRSGEHGRAGVTGQDYPAFSRSWGIFVRRVPLRGRSPSMCAICRAVLSGTGMPHPCVILTGWVLACGPDRQRRCGATGSRRASVAPDM